MNARVRICEHCGKTTNPIEVDRAYCTPCESILARLYADDDDDTDEYEGFDDDVRSDVVGRL